MLMMGTARGVKLVLALAVLVHALLSVTAAAADTTPLPLTSGISNEGNDVGGWRAMPDVPGAVLKQQPVGGKNATLTHYETDPTLYDASKILRAVIMVSGIDRVSWNEYIYLNASLARAAQGGVVDPSTVILSAPEFFIFQDAGAYPVDPANGFPTSTALVWADKDWGAGNDAVFPDKALMAGLPYRTSSGRRLRLGKRRDTPSVADGPGVGSFEALDALIDTYLNRTRFPNLNRVVIAGFSLGGQLVQRYSLLRSATDDDDRITYWISSPGSFLYLNSTRPDRIGKSCSSTYNNYKYGLQGIFPGYIRDSSQPVEANNLGKRLASRTVRYLVGLTDTIAGDNSCEANAQGRDHVIKMLNWAQKIAPWLPGAPGDGSLPVNTTLSLIRNVPHLDSQVIQSDPGVVTLFLEDYPSAGKNATAPPSNGLGSGTPEEAANAALPAVQLPGAATLVAMTVLATLLTGTALV